MYFENGRKYKITCLYTHQGFDRNIFLVHVNSLKERFQFVRRMVLGRLEATSYAHASNLSSVGPPNSTLTRRTWQPSWWWCNVWCFTVAEAPVVHFQPCLTFVLLHCGTGHLKNRLLPDLKPSQNVTKAFTLQTV